MIEGQRMVAVIGGVSSELPRKLFRERVEVVPPGQRPWTRAQSAHTQISQGSNAARGPGLGFVCILDFQGGTCEVVNGDVQGCQDIGKPFTP